LILKPPAFGSAVSSWGSNTKSIRARRIGRREWPSEPVLAAFGITTEARLVLVGLDAGASESTDVWKRTSLPPSARSSQPPPT
jgi:hypothetical protein